VWLWILALLMVVGEARAGNVRLGWDQSQGATGYKVHFGGAPATYSTTEDVGSVLGWESNTFVDGCATTYCAVTAYNSAGESGYSNEIAFIPRPIILAVPGVDTDGDQQVDTWYVNGGNFAPNCTATIDGNPIPFIHTQGQECEQLTIPVVSIPAAPTYSTLEVCNSWTSDDGSGHQTAVDDQGNPLGICASYLLVPQSPGSLGAS
jgi:hypothetical protein